MLPPKYILILRLIFYTVKLNSKAARESLCLSPLVVSTLFDSVPKTVEYFRQQQSNTHKTQLCDLYTFRSIPSCYMYRSVTL